MNMICAQPLSAPPYSPGGAHQATTASAIAEYADRALLAELMLTPKPGLVDRRNCGAHRDMDMHTFLASARAIAPWWPRFVAIGYASADIAARASLPLVRPAGVLCERAMLRATEGVNTHKGAIFSLGLLCFAAGRLLAHGIALARGRMCREVASICVGLVDRELDGTQEAHTAGERVFRRYGLTGARGEAAAGYATVRMAALPVYEHLRRDGVGEDAALLQVLLHLLAVNDDTNLVSRGGLAGLNYVRAYARQLLREGGALAPDGVKKMAAFDDALIARHLSPGGTADLLGLTWFLARLPTGVIGDDRVGVHVGLDGDCDARLDHTFHNRRDPIVDAHE
jgi:triphosphoribosyl-dephospho-CoA synthase